MANFPPPSRRPAGPKPYNHGDLRPGLFRPALKLAVNAGPRAAGEAGGAGVGRPGRGAGAAVSPGAPFRHFDSRAALMTAVAEEAQRRFRAEIEAALSEAPAGDPLARFRRLGRDH